MNRMQHCGAAKIDVLALLAMIVMLTGLVAPRAALAEEKAADSAKPAAQAPEGVFEDENAPKKDAPAEKDAGPLKVGVIISKFTATGPNWGGALYGYTHAVIAKDLAVDGIELHAIIEPGTDSDAELQAGLAENFPEGVPLIDGHDAEALKTLDVIVGQRVANMQDEMIAAIHHAVEAGTGLFISQTFGTVTPGYRNDICDLFGMESAGYAFNMTPVACAVQAQDPILEGTEDAGVEWQAQPSGTAGVMREGATPLVSATDITSVGVRQVRGDDTMLPMLYIAHFGKGGIVVSSFKELPDPLKNLTGDNFFVRCVKRARALRQE